MYVGVTYARFVYTWYTNISYMIAVLIVFLEVNGFFLMKKKSKRDSDETETRQCYC